MSQVPAQASSHALVVADVAQLKILVEGIRAEGGALFGSKIGQLKKKGFLYSGKSLKEFLSRCSGVIEKRSRGSDGQFELYLTQQFDKDEVQRQCDDEERGIKTSPKKKSRKEKKAEKNKNGGRKKNTARPKKTNTAAPMLNAAALNSHQKLGVQMQEQSTTLQELVSDESSDTSASDDENENDNGKGTDFTAVLQRWERSQGGTTSAPDDTDNAASSGQKKIFSSAVKSLFSSQDHRSRRDKRVASVVAAGDRSACKESALFGSVMLSPGISQPVYLNVHSPFCLTVCGVQGAGKSHTLAVVLESCLIPFMFGGLVELDQPMAALMFHYDQSETNVCEATGITKLHPKLSKALNSRSYFLYK